MKYVSIFYVLFLWSTAFSQTSVLPFTDGFESGNFTSGGWIVSGGASIVNSPVATGSKAAKGTNVYSLTKNFTAVSTGILDVTVKVNLSQTDKNACGISLKSGSDLLVHVFPRHTGDIEAYDGANNKIIYPSYSANTWYTIRIVADITTSKFDVYIDGVKKANQFGFSIVGKSIDNIVLSSGESSGSIAYIDDISIQSQSAVTTLPFTDGFESGNFTSGGWVVSGGASIVNSPVATGSKAAKGTNVYSLTKNFTAVSTGILDVTVKVNLSQTGKNACGISLMSGSDLLVHVFPRHTGNIEAYDGPIVSNVNNKVIYPGYSANTWYTIRIVADITTSKFDVYIDGVKKANQFGFSIVGKSIDNIVLSSGESSGSIAYIDDISLNNTTTFVEGNSIQPKDFTISQNYPNPFNPTTTIRFGLPRNSDIKITITNILGQTIATLYDGKKDAGFYETQWDATSHPSGVYFYHIKAVATDNSDKRFTETKKMLLLK